MQRQFYEWMLEKINEDDKIIKNLWMSNESHLHLNDYETFNFPKAIFSYKPNKILLRYPSLHHTVSRLPCDVHVVVRCIALPFKG